MQFAQSKQKHKYHGNTNTFPMKTLMEFVNGESIHSYRHFNYFSAAEFELFWTKTDSCIVVYYTIVGHFLWYGYLNIKAVVSHVI